MLIVAFLVGTILLVTASIEGGYQLGRFQRRRSNKEKESSVSAIEGSVLALLALILAFTFQTTSSRYDARGELVREEANAIRTVWTRADFLPEDARAESRQLLRTYLADRVAVFQSNSGERIKQVIEEAEQIQSRLWDLAVVHARTEMNSSVAALYFEALNALNAVHASRVAVALQMQIPIGIWAILTVLTIIGMAMVGYQAGIAASKRTLAMLFLAFGFAIVITLITSLDRPLGGFTLIRVSQQPLIDLLGDIDSGRLGG
jgi:hypothetical protein